jgi:hypothetical protein
MLVLAPVMMVLVAVMMVLVAVLLPRGKPQVPNLTTTVRPLPPRRRDEGAKRP